MPKYTARNDIRIFKSSGPLSPILYRTGKYIPVGMTVQTSKPRKMHYDHRSQDAVSFTFENETYWMLVNEMGLRLVS